MIAIMRCASQVSRSLPSCGGGTWTFQIVNSGAAIGSQVLASGVRSSSHRPFQAPTSGANAKEAASQASAKHGSQMLHAILINHQSSLHLILGVSLLVSRCKFPPKPNHHLHPIGCHSGQVGSPNERCPPVSLPTASSSTTCFQDLKLCIISIYAL